MRKTFYKKDEISNISNLSIVDTALSLGLSLEKADNRSLKVDGYGGLFIYPRTNRFYSFSGEAKGNVIDFVAFLKGLSFTEAMAFLGAKSSEIVNKKEPFPKNSIIINPDSKADRTLILPKKAKNYKRLFWYLMGERKIDKELVYLAVNRKIIYQDERGNVVFLGRDASGAIRYASLRGTYLDKTFKGDAPGSMKQYGFVLKGEDEKTIFVLESPIEVLSLASLIKLKSKGKKTGLEYTMISLGGRDIKHLDEFLLCHSDVKNIVIGLNNDKDSMRNWGQESASRIAAHYENKYNISNIIPTKNDWNEDLKELFK